MARKLKSRPSFFKVLIHDFTTKLYLPRAFVQKYGRLLPQRVKLRAGSGETWNVELDEIDDEEYCFVGGWKKFAKDTKLEMGEFLVFWYNIRSSSFDVSVYETSGCNRDVSAPAEDSDVVLMITDGQSSGNESDKLELEEEEINTHPHMEIVLNESRVSRVCVRKRFAEAARLTGKKAVVLEYPPKHRYWPVILKHSPRSGFSLDMAAGWPDFRKENGLVMGKTYSFEFNPTKNVIQVKEMTD